MVRDLVNISDEELEHILDTVETCKTCSYECFMNEGLVDGLCIDCLQSNQKKEIAKELQQIGLIDDLSIIPQDELKINNCLELPEELQEFGELSELPEETEEECQICFVLSPIDELDSNIVCPECQQLEEETGSEQCSDCGCYRHLNQRCICMDCEDLE